MATLDSLPADQRAVLQLVLQRGRSYEDIARLLSIDRTAVRQRALTAMDAIGPRTGLPDERRAMITDYLLGQLDDEQREQTRHRLAETPGERAWARVIASEIAPLANERLPEIPVEANGAGGGTSVAEPGPKTAEDDSKGQAGDRARTEPLGSEAPAAQRDPVSGQRDPVSAAAPPPLGSEPGAAEAPPPPTDGGPKVAGMPTSRRGGLILIGGVVAVAIVVALIVLLSGGSSSKKPSTAAANTPTTSTSASASATSSTTSTTSSTSSTAARVVAQINLTPPTAGSKAAGIAEVLKEGANNGIAIVAQNVPPNSTKPPNAYAVWLYNSPTDAHILGFVNPGVGKSGRLSTAGGLPANASHYKQLIVTVETQANPKTPGTVILRGALTGLS